MQVGSAKQKKGARNTATTRDTLMNVATELFAKRGFDGTTVDQIATRAGVNRAMISYHFGGKRALYNEILSATFSEAHKRFEAIRESDEPADVRLREFIGTFADLATLRPALPAMVIRQVISGGIHIDEQLLPQFLEIFNLVQDIIDQGIEEGTFSAVNPYMTHISLLGSLVFFFAFLPLRSRMEEKRIPAHIPEIAEYVHHLQEMMSRGLSVDGAAPEPA